MEFRTIVNIEKQNHEIEHRHNLFCVGSCFAENISERLLKHKFKTLVNPCGIMFNPVSISECLNYVSHNIKTEENSMFFYNGRWNNFMFHSRFSNPEKETAIKQMNNSVELAHSFLKAADYMIITLGSNLAYLNKKNNKIVVNCHKLPAADFEKVSLSASMIFEKLEESLLKIKKNRPNLQCIITVSPVRYIKDDFAENSYGKACLLQVAHDLKIKYDWISYFSAFEIMMDDLRDYRFYSKDHIHPSEEAIDYIWEKFSDFCFSFETKKLNKQIEMIESAFEHRVQFPKTKEYHEFCINSLEKIKEIKSKYPYMDFSLEESHFSQKF